MSWPAMDAYLPSRRNPVRRAMMRRGLSLSRTVVGSRPSFSRTPGRKGSTRMSALASRERNRECEVRDMRSRHIEDLWAIRRSVVGGAGCRGGLGEEEDECAGG